MPVPASILQIGHGDVCKKIEPALVGLKKEGLISQVAVCDIKEPEKPLHPVVDRFYLIKQGCRLPLEQLEVEGFLGDQVIALVTPCSSVHHVYCAILSPLVWRVGLEKPLDVDLLAAKVIVSQPNVWPIDHVLFKEPALQFIDRCRAEPWLLEMCNGFIGLYFETTGVNHRALDPVPLDIGYHLANLIATSLAAAGLPFQFHLQESFTAAYDRGDKPSGLHTASLLQGLIEAPYRSIPFLLAFGKGMPESHKALFIQGPEPLIVDLSESGPMPHYRAIRELLQPAPDMKTSLDISCRVLQLCVEAERLAKDQTSYDFGTWPDFIEELIPILSREGLIKEVQFHSSFRDPGER
jgi:hypothetical protein